jgi:hypothetical protein
MPTTVKIPANIPADEVCIVRPGEGIFAAVERRRCETGWEGGFSIFFPPGWHAPVGVAA